MSYPIHLCHHASTSTSTSVGQGSYLLSLNISSTSLDSVPNGVLILEEIISIIESNNSDEAKRKKARNKDHVQVLRSRPSVLISATFGLTRALGNTDTPRIGCRRSCGRSGGTATSRLDMSGGTRARTWRWDTLGLGCLHRPRTPLSKWCRH